MTKISSSSWDMEGPWRIYEHLDASWCFMGFDAAYLWSTLNQFESFCQYPLGSTTEHNPDVCQNLLFIKSFPAAENIISSLTRLMPEETVMSPGVETPLRCIKKTHRKRPPTAPDWPRSRVGRVGRPAAATRKRVQMVQFFLDSKPF